MEYTVFEELMETGGSNKALGQTLFIAESTVKSHMKRILHKTGTKTRSELITHVFHNQITVCREVIDDEYRVRK